jgi:cellulose synthase/poly-beta-1,6-N-acetylglucosamine synthase-like glycosyltransferase
LTEPVLTVVVPHYNDPAGLDACLAAIETQTLPRGRFTIVVGDNNSPQGRDALEATIRGRATLVVEPTRGAANARNAALKLVRTKYIAFTDSDCVPDPRWLETGLAELEGGAADFYGGEMQVLVPGGRAMNGAEAFEYVFAFQNERYVKIGFSVTANLFVPTAMFEQVGGFVDGVSEDKDWCLRAGAAGYRIGYAAGAIVRHPPRRDWPDLMKKWRRVHAEMAMLAKQKRGGRLDWLLRTWAMPVSALAHTPQVLANRRLSAKEKLRTLATLYRLRAWRFVDGHRQLLK